MTSHFLRLAAIGSFLAASLSACVAIAQTAPQIDYIFPAGAQRGTRSEVTWGGKFVPGRVRVNVHGSGIEATQEPVEDRFAITLAADAQPGPREVRVFVPQGGSAPHPFLVGDLPEIVRQPGDDAIALKLPVTVNGRLAAARDIHRYGIDLTAGQQVVAAATTRAIQSPVDPVMRLLDATGRVVAESRPHRTADALLTHRADAAGRFTLEMFDFQLAGSPRAIYRLTVTIGPWIDYAFPTSVQQNTAGEVVLHGWNLPGGDGKTSRLPIAARPAGDHEITLPGAANRFELQVGHTPQMVESEPNDTREQATSIAVPMTVHGRFEKPNDADFFAFKAAKGEKFAISVESARLRFPADPLITVTNEAGAKLTEIDDVPGSRDPKLQFTATADGTYYLHLRERSRQGGEEFIYRLSIGSLRPDVTARVNVPSFALHSGETAKLPVIVERLDGFEGELEVAALDVPSGITVEPQPVPKGAKQTVQLPITAAAALGPTAGLARIVVRTTAAKDTAAKDTAAKDTAAKEIAANVTREALIAETAQAATGSNVLWLAIAPEIPFELSHTSTIQEAPRMAALPFPIKVKRKEGFTSPIRLVGVEPDVRGTVVPLTGRIEAGSDDGALPLVLQQQVTEGTTHRCRVMGIAEVQGADGKPYTVFHVASGNMFLGCQPSYLSMVVEPAVVAAKPGSTVPVRVRLIRRVTIDAVRLRLDLPPTCRGITCEPVVVSPDAEEATLVLNMAADAHFPPRTTLTLEAESSRQGLPVYARTSLRLEQAP